MSDILIRDVPPELQRRIEERAHANKRSLSREIELLIQSGLAAPPRSKEFKAERAWGQFCRAWFPRIARQSISFSSATIPSARPLHSNDFARHTCYFGAFSSAA